MWPNPRIPYAMSSERPLLAPPPGGRIIVNLAMNIEYWPFDRPMPRGVLPPPHGRPADPPDVPNYAWVEYGMRAGMPRFLDALAARGLRCSALMNAQVAEVYPSLMDRLVAEGHEMVGHGWFQQTLKQADDEEAVIVRALDTLRRVSGQPVRAWLGPGLAETDATPDLLKKHGVQFLHDWLVEDLPVWMRTRHGPMLAMPYAFALNDVPIYVIEHSSSDELLKRMEATLKVFEAEDGPRVMTLSLHPHVVGTPHVFHWFATALDILRARDDVVFMTSSEIGDWFIAADGTHGAALAPFNDGPSA